MIINKYKYLISELSKFIQLCWCIIERKWVYVYSDNFEEKHSGSSKSREISF
jgi:hypothetical protein